MTNKIRIIVADDHPSVRLGIVGLLASNPGVAVVGEAHDAQSLTECLDDCPCDVVVTDIGMPGLNGESNAISLLRRLLRRGPCPAIVVVTMIRHAPILTGLLQFGVSAIIDKSDVAESLNESLASTLSRAPYLSTRAREAIEAPGAQAVARAGILSRREWEVFQLYAKGMAIHQIAKTLGRSGKTISTQKRSTMRKLGCESEAQLIEYARQIGLA